MTHSKTSHFCCVDVPSTSWGNPSESLELGELQCPLHLIQERLLNIAHSNAAEAEKPSFFGSIGCLLRHTHDHLLISRYLLGRALAAEQARCILDARSTADFKFATCCSRLPSPSSVLASGIPGMLLSASMAVRSSIFVSSLEGLEHSFHTSHCLLHGAEKSTRIRSRNATGHE